MFADHFESPTSQARPMPTWKQKRVTTKLVGLVASDAHLPEHPTKITPLHCMMMEAKVVEVDGHSK